MKNSLPIFVVAVAILSAAPVLANVDQTKIYKKALGLDKPKCAHCHVDKTPKKEEGKHQLNAYGQKLMKASEGKTPDEAAYKAVGPE